MNASFTHTHVEKFIYLEPFVHKGDGQVLKLSVKNLNLGPTFDSSKWATYSDWIKAVTVDLLICFSDIFLQNVVIRQVKAHSFFLIGKY
jgi:hypothetical protein